MTRTYRARPVKKGWVRVEPDVTRVCRGCGRDFFGPLSTTNRAVALHERDCPRRQAQKCTCACGHVHYSRADDRDAET